MQGCPQAMETLSMARWPACLVSRCVRRTHVKDVQWGSRLLEQAFKHPPTHTHTHMHAYAHTHTHSHACPSTQALHTALAASFTNLPCLQNTEAHTGAPMASGSTPHPLFPVRIPTGHLQSPADQRAQCDECCGLLLFPFPSQETWEGHFSSRGGVGEALIGLSPGCHGYP